MSLAGPTTVTMPLRWVSTAELVHDASVLASMLPTDVAAIAGIARSGMLPASIIAVQLHLPLYALSFQGLHAVGAGRRGAFGFAARQQRLAVIDDTVYSGAAMVRARAMIGSIPTVYACVYCRPEAAWSVDQYVRALPSPHLLEWNILNNGPLAGNAINPVYRRGIACDLDGIIVHDAYSGGAPGSPYMVPRLVPAPLIVTGRPERHREATIQQLRALGALWDRLEMLPNHLDQQDRQAIARWKADVLRGSSCGMMLESDPAQARMIYSLSGIPVICPAVRRVWPDAVQIQVPATSWDAGKSQDNRIAAVMTRTMDLECVCSGAGYCPKFNRQMSYREWQLCSCSCDDPRWCTPPLCAARRERWARQGPSSHPGQTAALRRPPAHGPGSELEKLLIELGITQRHHCGCQAMRQQMDAWGVDGCEHHRDEILTWLRRQQASAGWTTWLKAGAMAIVSGLAWRLDPTDPAPGLLDEAIRRAKAKDHTHAG